MTKIRGRKRVISENSGSDSEDDHDLLTTSDNDWSVEQNKELLKQIDALLPAKDTISFVKTLKIFDWSKIKIGQYAKDDIKSHFTNLISSVRTTRTLGEIIADCDIHNWQKSHADMPKRPLSAYNFFFKEKFNKVKADGDSTTAVVKKLSELYKNLNPKKKQKYIEKANVLQAGYYNAMLEFNSKHPDFEKKIRKAPSANSPAKVPIDLYIKELKANGDYFSLTDARTKWASLPIKKKVVFIRKLLETSDDNKNVSLPKKEKALLDDFEGKPRKPKNAFQLFTDEIRSEVAGKTFSLQAKELGKRWISSSADLKSKYTKLADQAKTAYIEKLKIYIKSLPADKQKELLTKSRNKQQKKKTQENDKIIPDQVIQIESDTDDEAIPVNIIKTKAKRVRNEQDENRAPKKKKSKPSSEEIEKPKEIEIGTQKRKTRQQNRQITLVDEHLSQNRQMETETSNVGNSDGLPRKKKNLSDDNLDPLQRPPKNAFTYFVLNFCDGNHEIAAAEWTLLGSKAKKQVDLQLDEKKDAFLAQLQERLLQTTDVDIVDIDIQPCDADYDSPGNSDAELESSEEEDSD